MASRASAHAARHAHQLGQLGAVHVVVACDDVVYQLGRRARVGQGVGALQRRQLVHHGLQVQALFAGGLAQAHLAAAAEVELQAPEHGRGAGQLHGDLAYGLAGVDGGGCCGSDGVHGGYLS